MYLLCTYNTEKDPKDYYTQSEMDSLEKAEQGAISQVLKSAFESIPTKTRTACAVFSKEEYGLIENSFSKLKPLLRANHTIDDFVEEILRPVCKGTKKQPWKLERIDTKLTEYSMLSDLCIILKNFK